MQIVKIGSSQFYADEIIFSAQTKIAETALTSGKIYRTVTGSQQAEITVKSRVLPSDESFFRALISDCAGKSGLTVTTGDNEVSGMSMKSASLKFTSGSLYGSLEMNFIKL